MDMYVPEGFRGDDIDPDELDREWEKHRQMQEDIINSPKHYTFGKYEVIDVLEDWHGDDPLLFMATKYIARCKYKGNMVQDLRKCIWYIERRIAKEENASTDKSSG